jgi:hypothetical protein
MIIWCDDFDTRRTFGKDFDDQVCLCTVNYEFFLYVLYFVKVII